jgi:hypothetical protein
MSLTKFDVHTHVVPPFWKDAVDAAGKIPSPPVGTTHCVCEMFTGLVNSSII